MHDAIHRFGAREVVMAGPMRRPALSSLALDRRASSMLLRAGRRAFGDDGLLSVIVEELEGDGLTVIGLDDVIAGVLAPSGHMAGPEPDQEGIADIRRGLEGVATDGGRRCRAMRGGAARHRAGARGDRGNRCHDRARRSAAPAGARPGPGQGQQAGAGTQGRSADRGCADPRGGGRRAGSAALPSRQAARCCSTARK